MSINTYALCSLTDVKLFMGVTGANSDMDDLLSDIINRFSTLFETYIGRNILSRSYTETHDGGGYYMLFTNQYPIISVESIHDSTDWAWTDSILIESDYYMITSGDNFNAVVLKSTTFYDYVENVQIIYTAGYTTVPEDIQQCIIEEVAKSYKNKQELGVTIKSLNDDSVHYTAQGLLSKTEQVLNKYKRLGAV